MSFFDELKRRNVSRVGFACALVAWMIAQVTDLARTLMKIKQIPMTNYTYQSKLTSA